MSRRGALAGLALFLATAAPLRAHPGVGIVMDARGNVFYTDLKQVWKISPDGRKRVVVSNVHSHELCLDAQQNLYGEHLWYEGDTTGKWGHRAWRLSPDGALTVVVPAREGFRTDYSFVRDGTRAMYWVEGEGPRRFRKRAGTGVVSTVAECRDCRDVRWMTAAPDGTLYFVDGTDLREVSPGGVIRTLARRVGRRTWTHPQAGKRHIVMGVWADAARNVYAAVYGSGEVKRVSPDGRVQVVAKSRLPWSPTGGMMAPNGDLWLLEYSYTNAVRVRRIGPRGRITVF
jgi:sugar lactone lactonase YvrE